MTKQVIITFFPHQPPKVKKPSKDSEIYKIKMHMFHALSLLLLYGIV